MTTLTHPFTRLLALFAAVMIFAAACSSEGSFAEVATADDDTETPQPVADDPVEEPTAVPQEDPTAVPEETPTEAPEPTTVAEPTPAPTEEPPIVDDPPPIVEDPPPSSDCTIDINATTAFGEGELTAGFIPDPFSVEVTSGGCVDAQTVIDPTCRGGVAQAPDYRLRYTGTIAPQLRFYFVAADGTSDTTLVVNAPDESWNCNDDFGAIGDPLVEFVSPEEGRYDIWVGSYNNAERIPGTLYISELSSLSPENPTGTTPNRADTGTLDVTGEALFGTTTLSPNFAPDPFSVSVISGGPNSAQDIDSSCRGGVANRPDYRFELPAGADNIRVFFEPTESGDTTLVMLDAAGQWQCDDDGGPGLNPQIDLTSAAPGTYNVWIGTYADDGSEISGILYITKQDIDSDDV